MSGDEHHPPALGHADRAGFLILGRGVGLGAGLVAPIILTRLLSRDAFGSYRQLILLSSLLSTLVMLGLPRSVLYFFPRVKQSSRRALVFQDSVLLVLLGVASAAGLVLLRTPVGRLFHNPALIRLLPMFSVYAGTVIATGHVYNLLVVQERIRRAAVFSAVISCVPTLGAVVGAFAPGGLDGAVLGVSLGGIAVALWSGALIWGSLTTARTENGRQWWESDLFREQLRYGIPLGLAGAVGAAERWVDHLVVSLLLLPAAYALYSIGSFAIPPAALLRDAVNTALVPAWARMFQQGQAVSAMDLFRRSTRRVALVALPATVLLVIIAPDLTRLLFSSQYDRSVPVFRVFLIMLAVHVFAPGGLLQGMGLTKAIFSGALWALVLGTGLTALGIHLGGLPGAALGKVVSECLCKAYYAWVIRRQVGKEPGALLPWGDLLRIGGLAALAGLPPAALAWLLPGGVSRLAATFLIYAIACAALMSATRTLTQGDRDLIRRWLSPRFLVGRAGN